MKTTTYILQFKAGRSAWWFLDSGSKRAMVAARDKPRELGHPYKYRVIKRTEEVIKI